MKKRKVKLFASIASLGLVVAVMGVGVWAATQQAVKVSSQVSFTATSVAADIKLSVNNAVMPEGLDTSNPTEAAKYAAGMEYDIVKEATLSDAYQTGEGVPTDKWYAKSDKFEHLLYSEKTVTKNEETGKYVEGTGEAANIGFGADRAQPQYIARFINDTQKTLYENRVYLNLQDKDEDGYLNAGAQVVYTFTIAALQSSAPIYYDITADLFETQIGDTEYTLNDVFDVTVTDTEKTSFTDTTHDETTDVVNITNWTHDVDTGVTTTEDDNAIQPGETRTITVVYTVKDLKTDIGGAEYATYQGIAYTMKSLQLGDIYIKLANNNKNLGELPDKEEQGSFPFDNKVDWQAPKTENPFDAIQGEPEGE